MKKQEPQPTTPKPSPFIDMTSVDVEFQIQHQLETLLDILDLRIHHKPPQTPEEVENILWNLRLLVESTLAKYNHIFHV